MFALGQCFSQCRGNTVWQRCSGVFSQCIALRFQSVAATFALSLQLLTCLCLGRIDVHCGFSACRFSIWVVVRLTLRMLIEQGSVVQLRIANAGELGFARVPSAVRDADGSSSQGSATHRWLETSRSPSPTVTVICRSYHHECPEVFRASKQASAHCLLAKVCIRARSYGSAPSTTP